MKFKKEYRWLLFLVIPFVVFMFILFMAPLEIILNAQPLATQTYNIQKGEMKQSQLRSTSHLSYKKVNSYFQSCIKPLLDLFSNQKPQLFSIINVKQISLNNAYNYYQNKANSNAIANQSMWFAQYKQNIQEFTSSQTIIYQNYIKIQGSLRSYLASTNQMRDSIIGVYNFYDINGSLNEDLAFYYPSYQQTNYSSLNYTIDQTLYQYLITNYRHSNNPLMLLKNTRGNRSSNMMSLCKLRIAANTTNGFTCLDVDLVKFNLINNIGSMNSYLITPNYETISNSTIIDNITSGVINIQHQYNIQSHISAFSTLKPTVQTLSTPSMAVTKYNYNTYYLFSFYIYDQILQTYNVFGYYLTQNYESPSTVNLQSNDVVSSSLNTLLIPTIILIVISLILSVVVLRFLMNGLDLQLHRLNQRCKFIFDGDLQIEIPEYKGTKDIYEVYEQVKIINKLHRYTSKDYFVGHFSNRIFKYNEALQVVTKLKYDPSNLMENIGEAYLYVEEYDKSIYYLKESVRYIEQQIDQDFGGLDRMVMLKQQKQKTPSGYKEQEILLIRRLWKLVFCLFKYVELQIMNAKQLDQQNLTETEKAQKKQRLQKQTLEYITKLKKAIYPDFNFFAESIMLLNFQIKFLLSIKNFEEAKDCLIRCDKVTKAYSKEYDGISKKLKEKGSKNLYFFRKNKLSGHSRSSPNIMQAFYLYTKGVVLTNDPQSKDYNTAAIGFLQALKKNVFSHSVNYLLFNQIKKLFGALKVGLQKLQTTQLFRQSMPYKTLYYGAVNKEIEATLYRIARNPIEVQSREIIISLDASYYYSTEKELTDQLKYLKQRSQYLYDKLIKNYDRVSLVQSNSQIGVQTLCNLTLKESNESILRKSLIDMTNYKSFNGKNQLISSLHKIIFRIKNLLCEKVVIVFLKYISSYIDQVTYKGKVKSKYKLKKRLTEPKIQQKIKCEFIEEIGEAIQEIMSVQGLRNCKLLLMCATNDDYYRLINVFGLRDINKRIWSHTARLNKNNNVVYIIDQKHKNDLDRILMSKIGNVSDNHVFAL